MAVKKRAFVVKSAFVANWRAPNSARRPAQVASAASSACLLDLIGVQAAAVAVVSVVNAASGHPYRFDVLAALSKPCGQVAALTCRPQ